MSERCEATYDTVTVGRKLVGSTVKSHYAAMMKGRSFNGSRPVNYPVGRSQSLPHSHSSGRDSMADRVPRSLLGTMATELVRRVQWLAARVRHRYWNSGGPTGR